MVLVVDELGAGGGHHGLIVRDDGQEAALRGRAGIVRDGLHRVVRLGVLRGPAREPAAAAAEREDDKHRQHDRRQLARAGQAHADEDGVAEGDEFTILLLGISVQLVASELV